MTGNPKPVAPGTPPTAEQIAHGVFNSQGHSEGRLATLRQTLKGLDQWRADIAKAIQQEEGNLAGFNALAAEHRVKLAEARQPGAALAHRVIGVLQAARSAWKGGA